MIHGKTLVLLDEIRSCPDAPTAIKFPLEDGRFDYVEAGSLLGVKYEEVRSHPAGFEEPHQMYTIGLEEYLRANGVQKSTIQYLKDCYENGTPVTDTIHQTVCELYGKCAVCDPGRRTEDQYLYNFQSQ